MQLYYDSSAIVPLLIQERHTSQSFALWEKRKPPMLGAGVWWKSRPH
jgi:hypothetical protein